MIPIKKWRHWAREFLLTSYYNSTFGAYCINIQNVISAKIHNKKIYDVIYSIGHDCSCAANLKRFHLRNTSGVLDWLWGPTLSEVFKVLSDDFKDFLIKDDLEKLAKNPVQTNHDLSHDYYHNKRNNYEFLHDFPSNIPLSDCFDTVKEKYNRRIARFLDDIYSNKDILLVYLMNHNTFKYSDKELIRLCNAYCLHIGRSVDFLFIANDQSMGHLISEKAIQKNIVKISLSIDTSKNQNGTKKQLRPIFIKYALKHLKYNLDRKK